jgi:hypothetical protein
MVAYCKFTFSALALLISAAKILIFLEKSKNIFKQEK